MDFVLDFDTKYKSFVRPVKLPYQTVQLTINSALVPIKDIEIPDFSRNM
jgi:hypothetical protein